MTRSARLLIAHDREPSADCVAFCAAIPTLVDGGARVVALYRYCPADAAGPAAAPVLVHWGEDAALPAWGPHVLSHDVEIGRHLLWQGRYFDRFDDARADLCDRMPTWSIVGRAIEDCAGVIEGRPRRSPARLSEARCDRRRREGGQQAG